MRASTVEGAHAGRIAEAGKQARRGSGPSHFRAYSLSDLSAKLGVPRRPSDVGEYGLPCNSARGKLGRWVRELHFPDPRLGPPAGGAVTTAEKSPD
jgi:hypothetical protein